MAEVIFTFNGKETIIKCRLKDQMKIMLEKFAKNMGKDIINLLFTYDGKEINEELTFKEIADNEEKNIKKIRILVEEMTFQENSYNFKEIICPKCNKSARIKIEDYKISIYNCKNGHKINNILFNEYEKMQNNNLYICQNCYKKKNITELYKCIKCEMNLCQICKLKHNKSHKIIDYIYKDCICKKHNAFFIKYCNQCKENICKSCDEHENHNKIDLEEIIQNKKIINIQIIKLQKSIDKLNDYINDKIEKLNSFKNNIEKYYNFSSNYIYKNKIKNYQTLQNIKEFENYNNIVLNDINKIINDEEDNTANKLNFMIDINNKINIKANEDLFVKYMNKINYRFKKNPNFKYDSEIVRDNDCSGIYDIFEVYNLYKDDNQYIASPNRITKYIDIYSVIDNQKILSLKGHLKNITAIKYFFNAKNFNEYLISADTNKKVIIWDINKNYIIKFKINTHYGSKIYSCLLVFPHNNEDMIITSTQNEEKRKKLKFVSATKAYSLNNGNFIKYIDNKSYCFKIFYLLSWYNKNNNNYYIIQFSTNDIFINNLSNDEDYYSFHKGSYIYQPHPDNYCFSGFIYNIDNNDFLFFISKFSLKIFDLYNKNIINSIEIKHSTIININPWNDNYLIIIAKDSFQIIDFINYKTISIFYFGNLVNIKSIKRINHPVYGESILSCGDNKSITLWKI